MSEERTISFEDLKHILLDIVEQIKLATEYGTHTVGQRRKHETHIKEMIEGL